MPSSYAYFLCLLPVSLPCLLLCPANFLALPFSLPCLLPCPTCRFTFFYECTLHGYIASYYLFRNIYTGYTLQFTKLLLRVSCTKVKIKAYTLIYLIFAQLQISRIFFLRIQFWRTPISRTFIFRAPHRVLVGNCQLSSHQRFP